MCPIVCILGWAPWGPPRLWYSVWAEGGWCRTRGGGRGCCVCTDRFFPASHHRKHWSWTTTADCRTTAAAEAGTITFVYLTLGMETVDFPSELIFFCCWVKSPKIILVKILLATQQLQWISSIIFIFNQEPRDYCSPVGRCYQWKILFPLVAVCPETSISMWWFAEFTCCSCLSTSIVFYFQAFSKKRWFYFL